MLLRSNNFLKYILFFFIGGFAYGGIEIIYRGYSHISMLIAGGICFILIGLINGVFSGERSFINLMFISAAIITLVEFVVGLIVNVWLNLNVWDYSVQPFNFMGQVCIRYSLYWFFLSPIAIYMDNILHRYILREEKHQYEVL